MKIIPIILSLILASSALGYGIHASAQTPCTASQPCAPICGDHLCAPGEVPTSGMAGSASTTKAVPQNTNKTGAPSVAEQMNISANVTATKTANGMKNAMNGTSMQENMAMGANTAATKSSNGNMANGTMTTGSMNSGSMPMASKLPSPNAQVTAGAQPANVKCISGFYLVINNANSRPACVTQNTMSLLEARGWGHAAP
ncbi:MAG: hypothetical protein WA799_00280 [Nitrosotalea sp.]